MNLVRVVLMIVELSQSSEKLANVFTGGPFLVRCLTYSTLVLLVLMFGVFTEEPFLYFQF